MKTFQRTITFLLSTLIVLSLSFQPAQTSDQKQSDGPEFDWSEAADLPVSTQTQDPPEKFPQNETNIVRDHFVFESRMGTFTEITGGTLLATNPRSGENFSYIDIGFIFNFDQVDHQMISINANGFLRFSTLLGYGDCGYNPFLIDYDPYCRNIAVAFGKGITQGTNSTLRYELIGQAPYRRLVVQWKEILVGTSPMTFQIHLLETYNAVEFHYGVINPLPYDLPVPVGIKGFDKDYEVRTTTTSWLELSRGLTANDMMLISQTVFPPSGLVYRFTQPPRPPKFITSMKTMPKYLVSGEQLPVSLEVVNSGDLTANNAVLTDPLPKEQNWSVGVLPAAAETVVLIPILIR